MEIKIGGKTRFENLLKNNYSICPCWIWSDYNQLALRARWLFYHFISNSGSWNNCYIVICFWSWAKRIFWRPTCYISLFSHNYNNNYEVTFSCKCFCLTSWTIALLATGLIVYYCTIIICSWKSTWNPMETVPGSNAHLLRMDVGHL